MFRNSLIPLSNRRIFDDMDKFFIESFKQDTTYPPYNVYFEEGDEDTQFVEIAVSGFDKEDLQVYFDDEGFLVIEGKKESSDKKYIHKGLSKKNFVRKFEVPKTLDVKNIEVKNGLMLIELSRVEPNKKLLTIN